MGTEKKPYYMVQTLERALLLLNEFIIENKSMSITYLAKKLGLHKSIVHRLVATLCHYNYLEKTSEGDMYRIGKKSFQLGAVYMNTTSLVRDSREYLSKLVNETGMDVHLAVLDHGTVLYVLNLEPVRSDRRYTYFGTRNMVNFTALGKCLTAWMSEEEVLDILEQEGMPSRSPYTITDPQKFLEELQRVREFKYAVDDEESGLGRRCLGAPVFDFSGEVVAAVSISGTVKSIPNSRKQELIEKVKTCGRLISARLGYIE